MHSSSGCDIRLVGHDQYFVNKTEEYKVGWNGIDPGRRKWQPTPVLLPWKLHGQRSLAGYSPWGRKESDMTERAWTRNPQTGLHMERQVYFHETYLLSMVCVYISLYTSSMIHSPKPLFVFFLITFQLFCETCRILLPRLGIKSVPLTVEVWSLNHWPPGKSMKTTVLMYQTLRDILDLILTGNHLLSRFGMSWQCPEQTTVPGRNEMTHSVNSYHNDHSACLLNFIYLQVLCECFTSIINAFMPVTTL